MTNEGRGLRRWTLVRASSAAVPASVRRRAATATHAEPDTASARLFGERARRHRRHQAAPWLASLAGAAVLGVLAVVVYATPVLGVRRVEVRGNMVVSDAQVRSAAAVPDGAPLASLDLGAIGRRVSALVAVRRVRVGRDWPSTVVIAVTERSAVAVLPAAGGTFRLIDPSGVVFRTVPARPAGLAVLVLANPGPDDPGTRAGLSVLAALTGELRGTLVRLVVASPARISLELVGDRTVVWGDARENEAKAAVATALLHRPGTTIDVSAPSVVTVN